MSEGQAGPAAAVFDIEVETIRDGSLCVRVSGEIDLATAPQLRTSLSDALSQASEVVLDLGGVGFIDSTGLAAIISGAHAAESCGADFRLASPLPAQPQRLLELTGVAERLSFTEAPPCQI